MSVVMITGNSYRHAHVVQSVAQEGLLSGWVIEEREPFLPEAPAHLSEDLKKLFNFHFQDRERAEKQWFGQTSGVSVPRLKIKREELNSCKVIDFVNSHSPKALVSYGCHKLLDKTLNAISTQFKWNTHGGLSPWYRGTTTHFWPSYMLEPQMTGMTLHELTTELDAGDVIHQTLAPLNPEDGLHDLACRTVSSYTEELPRVLQIALDGKIQKPKAHKTAGKLWLEKDWQPEHLRLIYEQYSNRIVQHYLEGKFVQRNPEVVRQW